MFALFITTSMAAFSRGGGSGGGKRGVIFQAAEETSSLLDYHLAPLANLAEVQGLGESEHKCNEKDMKNAIHLQKDMGVCMKDMNFTGLPDCLEKDGFSRPCIGCIQQMVACTMRYCIDDCKDQKSKACLKCSNEHCMKPFSHCSGFPTIDPNGKCGDAKDLKKLAKVKQISMGCLWTLMIPAGPSFAQCMHWNGFSTGCAGCIGGMVNCVKNDCKSQCGIFKSKSDGCKTCTKTKCMPSFGQCSGIHMPKAASGFLSLMA